MAKGLKCGLYLFSKWIGLFNIARLIRRRSLKIICYHGFVISDEDSFRPKLFMRPETFNRRMQYLSAAGYTVLGLEEACSGLKGELPDNAVVITIDDGFYSVFRCAWPILRNFSFPATVYVSTYYVQKGNPIFRLVVQYMFWKTKARELDTTGLGLPLSEVCPMRPKEKKDEVMREIIRFGETILEEPDRKALAFELGERLGVGYADIHDSRGLSLMTPEEIRTLAGSGLDIQLHTHRHQLPEDPNLLQREIEQNREFLEPLAGKKLQHLCYPSGIWSKELWPWLERVGIISAMTCDPGPNYPETPRLGLRRFLDGENISQIEFEAELCGLSELLRSARAFLRRS